MCNGMVDDAAEYGQCSFLAACKVGCGCYHSYCCCSGYSIFLKQEIHPVCKTCSSGWRVWVGYAG